MPTPEENRLKIETLRGDVKALETKMDSHLEQQAENGKRIDENVSEIKSALNGFIEKQEAYTTRHFEKSDEQGNEITKIQGKIDGHVELCDQRNENIHNTFGQMQATVAQTIKTAMAEGSVALAQSQLSSGKESKDTWKWIIGTIIAIGLSAGWLF